MSGEVPKFNAEDSQSIQLDINLLDNSSILVIAGNSLSFHNYSTWNPYKVLP
jgi:hypothetical protein